ncbi:hypothetical protein P9112_011603 [Eukaryota sp. TZLM1-RC]
MSINFKQSQKILSEWLPNRMDPQAMNRRLCKSANLPENADPFLIPSQEAHIAALICKLKREEAMRLSRELEDGLLSNLERERLALEEAVNAQQISMVQLEQNLRAECDSGWFMSEELEKLKAKMQSKQASTKEIEQSVRSLAEAAKELEEHAATAKERELVVRETSALKEQAQHLEVEIQQLEQMKSETAAGIR